MGGAGSELKRDSILVFTFTVLDAARGDSTNEREAIACFQMNFLPYVLSLMRIPAKFDSRTQIQTLLKNSKVVWFPYLDRRGFRLLQVLIFALMSGIFILVFRVSIKPLAVIVSHPIICSIIIPFAKIARLPILYRVHSVPLLSAEDPFRGGPLGTIVRMFDVAAIQESDLIQVATLRSSRQIPHARKVLIPYSVNPAFYDVRRHRHSSFVVGFIGNFSPTRDFSELLKAITCVKNDVSDLRLVLVGYGERKKEVERMVKALGLQEITEVRPAVPHDTVPQLLSTLDVLVNPQLPANTALSMKIVEAMAAGIPVITTVDQKGLLKHMKNCIIVKNNHKSYELALGLLYRDKKLRTKIGTNARKTAMKSFSRGAVAGLYKNAIRVLIENHRIFSVKRK